MKNLVIALVVLAILGAGGYYVMKSQQSKAPEVTVIPAPTSTGLFSSIQDALARGLSLKCVYPDPRSKASVTTYIKNGMVRSSGVSVQSDKTANVIIKDNKMWIWSDGTTTGMILDLSIPAKVSPAVTSTPTREDQKQRLMSELEQFKSNCQTAVVDDALFVPPSNVTFSSLPSMFNSNSPNGMPSGVPSGVPGNPSRPGWSY